MSVEYRNAITQLARSDPEYRLDGSEVHRYELCEPMGESELQLLEETLGVSLPDDYRAFLKSVANGGAGPGEGLESLSFSSIPQALQVRRWTRKLGYDVNAECLTDGPLLPFPLLQPHCSLPAEMRREIGDQRFWGDDHHVTYAQSKEVFWQIPFENGILRIGVMNKGVEVVLVLEGRFRGQVWVIDAYRGFYTPISMRRDLYDFNVLFWSDVSAELPPAFTFSEWYADWYVTAEREIATLY